MKKIILLIISTIIVAFFWSISGSKTFDRSRYITQEVLDTSVPIDVKIDLELINSLAPAYER